MKGWPNNTNIHWNHFIFISQSQRLIFCETGATLACAFKLLNISQRIITAPFVSELEKVSHKDYCVSLCQLFTILRLKWVLNYRL